MMQHDNGISVSQKCYYLRAFRNRNLQHYFVITVKIGYMVYVQYM